LIAAIAIARAALGGLVGKATAAIADGVWRYSGPAFVPPPSRIEDKGPQR
jgi:hypothetical protein